MFEIKLNIVTNPSCLYFRRNGWNEYQIKLEKKISDDSQVLARNEQYIKNQDGIIRNLSRDKHNLETRLSEETGNYDEQLEKVADVLEELKGKFAMAEKSYNVDMSEMRQTHNLLFNKNNSYFLTWL